MGKTDLSSLIKKKYHFGKTTKIIIDWKRSAMENKEIPFEYKDKKGVFVLQSHHSGAHRSTVSGIVKLKNMTYAATIDVDKLIDGRIGGLIRYSDLFLGI